MHRAAGLTLDLLLLGLGLGLELKPKVLVLARALHAVKEASGKGHAQLGENRAQAVGQVALLALGKHDCRHLGKGGSQHDGPRPQPHPLGRSEHVHTRATLKVHAGVAALSHGSHHLEELASKLNGTRRGS